MQYLAWRAVTSVVARLPRAIAYALADVAGFAGYYAWPRGRRNMAANYRHVLPGASPRVRSAVARRSLQNYCRSLVDFARLPRMDRDEVIAACEGAGAFATLDEALSAGKGAIVALMHFGNWDLGGAATAARGYPATVLVEEFADPRLDAMVRGARERLGLRLIAYHRAGPSLVRTLRSGGVLGMLFDRPVPGEGVEVPFFGASVSVPAGPARLSLMTGAPLVAAAFVRTHGGRVHVEASSIDVAPTGDNREDMARVTKEIMKVHERFIRRYPSQWYMFRNMWAFSPELSP